MNQFLLALRSLLIAILIFLVMAFFAAKFFGGTLFPRPPRVDFPAVTVGGHSYFLSVTREEGKAPAFSVRQLDATDPSSSVLLVPQSDRESDAWRWAEVQPLAPGGPLRVRFTLADGTTGVCEIGLDGRATISK
ncbi:MAG: hypothetical protein U0625_08280 [Phycisphaerales bacterium]